MKRRQLVIALITCFVLALAGCGGGGGGSDSGGSSSSGGTSSGGSTAKTGTITLISPDYPIGSTVQEVSVGTSQTGPWKYSVGSIPRNTTKTITVPAPGEYWARWKMTDSIGGYAPIYKTGKIGNLSAGGSLRYTVITAY